MPSLLRLFTTITQCYACMIEYYCTEGRKDIFQLRHSEHSEHSHSVFVVLGYLNKKKKDNDMHVSHRVIVGKHSEKVYGA